MAVAFEELIGSPDFSLKSGKFQGRREFKVDWGDRLAFALELYGGQVISGGGTVVYPQSPFPGIRGSVCTGVAIKPFHDRIIAGPATLDSGSTYEHAHVVADYEIPYGSPSGQKPRDDAPSVPGGTFLTYDGSTGAEYQTIPGRAWHWPNNDKLSEDVNAGILIPCGEFSLTWHRVTLPPWNAIRDKRGMINTGTFLNHPDGTVLFLGSTESIDFQFDTGVGSPQKPMWKLSYKFKVRSIEKSGGGKVGWNYYFKEVAESGENWLIIKNDQNKPPFASTTFSGLFAFEA